MSFPNGNAANRWFEVVLLGRENQRVKRASGKPSQWATGTRFGEPDEFGLGCNRIFGTEGGKLRCIYLHATTVLSLARERNFG